MSEDQAGKQGFKVSDRRRFDEQGNAKDGEAASVKQATAEPAAQAAATQGKAASAPVEITFSSFIMSLATSAMMQLGEMPAPPEMQIAVDPAAARGTIDLLTVLEKKTKGNLDENEARLLEELLHALRMSYVKHSV